MPKTPLSVTLDDANLLWLKGRATGRKRRSLSDALDEILTAARRGGAGGDVARSVVGTIDIAGEDPLLERADAAVWSIVDESLSRPILVRETPDGPPSASAKKRGAVKRRA